MRQFALDVQSLKTHVEYFLKSHNMQTGLCDCLRCSKGSVAKLSPI